MKRYHKEVKFNENLIKHLAPYKMKLTTTPHFINRTKRKKIPYPSKKLLKKGEIFEYYTDDLGKLVKFVIRCHYSEKLDVCYVISCIGSIITGWWQNSDDCHVTLKLNLYER
nr:MAG TPA: hypothetical protein [Caudoviricetes sp.]